MSRAMLWLLQRRHLTACLACCIPPVVVAVLIGVLYPTLVASQEGLRTLVSLFEDLVGGGMLDIFTSRGIFQFPFHHPLTLLSFALAAALPALSIPAGERGLGGLELFLSTSLERRPLVHTVLVFQALIAPAVAFSPLLGVWIGSSISGVRDQLELSTFALIPLQGTLLMLALSSVATLISVWSPDMRRAAIAFGAFAFVGALARVVSEMWPEGPWVQFISPLGWYRPPEIVFEGRLRWTCTVALCLWIVIPAALASHAAHHRSRV